MQRIIPYLWYDKEAAEAAALYVSIFPDSRTLYSSPVSDTPSGQVDIITVSLSGTEFTLISGGPYFNFNPSISFLVACDEKAEVDRLYEKLSSGNDLMPLGSYPFSERYAWVADRFGVSWQLMYMGSIPYVSKITPTLMFTGANCGKAEEAMRLYASVLPSSSVDMIARYERGAEPDAAGTVQHGAFTLAGKHFAAMDSAYPHGFSFNEAVSLMVQCDTQAEIDALWKALSAVPEAEQCGWLKDRYGLSWQIVPAVLGEMMSSGNPESVGRVTKAFLAMKKFDISALERAHRGE